MCVYIFLFSFGTCLAKCNGSVCVTGFHGRSTTPDRLTDACSMGNWSKYHQVSYLLVIPSNQGPNLNSSRIISIYYRIRKTRLLLPPFPFHNIRDFKFLFILFDHSSYSKNLYKYKKRKVVIKVLWIIK